MHKLLELKNGLNCVLAPLHETEAVTVLVLVKVGSRYEADKINGISHFIEHLLFKGTPSRPTSLHLTKELDSLGAEYNAFTDKDHTGYYIKVHKRHLVQAVEIVSDMLFNSLFEEKEINRERGVIIEEIKMYEDNPLMYIGDVLEKAMFQDHPLGNRISGPQSNLKTITREEIVKYYNKYYFTSNLMIGIAGNFTEAEGKVLAEKHFGRHKLNQIKDDFQRFSAKQNKLQINIEARDSQQVQLALGFMAYKRTDPKIYPLSLLAVILGGSMSSRLFTAIREKRGLAYFISASTVLYEDVGALYLQAGLDQTRLPAALKIFKDELIRIKQKGVFVPEFKRAKEFLKGRMVLPLEDSARMIGWLLEQKLLNGKLEDLSEKIKKIDSVTVEQVNRVAQEVIDFKKCSVGFIGPLIKPEVFQKIFN